MKLYFSTLFDLAYPKALMIAKNEQPKMWEFFSREISIFSAVSNCYIASICAQWVYRSVIRESKVLYEKCWEKEKEFIESKLSKLFGVSLKKRKITAYICVTPLYIRNIHRGLFLLPVGSDSGRILNIIVHELSHFYCYQAYDSYRYTGKDAWEISEYIVQYLIEKHFCEICQLREQSYLGDVPECYEKHIKSWVNMECDFKEMLERIRLEV